MWLRLTTICSGCEGEGFEFVGAVGLSGEVCFCFSGVGFFACGKVGVFGVIEHQVFHLKHFCLRSGIEGGAVVFIVGAYMITNVSHSIKPGDVETESAAVPQLPNY